MRSWVVTRGTFVLPALFLALSSGWQLVEERRVGAQSPRQTPAPAAAALPAKLTAAAGQFRQYCARCHGADATGRAWRERGRRIPDFTNGPWQNSRADAHLVVSILEGKGAGMPAFSDKLSKEQARDLVRLIRKASSTRAIAAKASPTDFAQRYAELRAELEDLRTQFWELERASRQRSARGDRRGGALPEPH